MQVRKEFSALVIYNSKRQILLQDRRSISKYWEYWGLFWWGIKDWETPYQAVVREIKEELWLDVNPIFMKTFTRYTWATYNLYACKIDLDEKDFNVYEWDWAQFFTIKELRVLNSEKAFWSDYSDMIDIIEEYSLKLV